MSSWDFWEEINAPPGLVAAADQTDMHANDYLDEAVSNYIVALKEAPNLPLTVAALSFYRVFNNSEPMGLFFAGYVMALAVRRLAEQKMEGAGDEPDSQIQGQ